jgi:hypothetical protein
MDYDRESSQRDEDQFCSPHFRSKILVFNSHCLVDHFSLGKLIDRLMGR